MSNTSISSLAVIERYAKEAEIKKLAETILKAMDIFVKSYNKKEMIYKKDFLQASNEAVSELKMDKFWVSIVYDLIQAEHWNESGDWARKQLGDTGIDLTDNEKAILKGGCESNYSDFRIDATWVFDCIDCSELHPKVARGAIASLVKKGLVTVFDNEGNGKSDDMAIHATSEGIEVCNQLGF